MQKRSKLGLVGKDISYSFSKKYFKEKFNKLELNHFSYENFDLQNIEELPSVLNKNKDSLRGFNVTIPYKLEIFKYLDKIDKVASEIGAVNTVRISKNGKLEGFNTDTFGFEESLKPLLKSHVKKALILGTGGASKAIAFVLDKIKIEYKFVSRNPENDQIISYDKLDENIIKNHHLIINCTPLGTFPNTESLPGIPYQFLTDKHFLYDLIYNPEVSSFLGMGKKKGAIIKNGKQMLELQADKAWEIWTI